MSGFINFGQSRILTIPKNTALNMPIQVFLQSKATIKETFFSARLESDFKSSPVLCFKTWGTLFNPMGGKCN